MLDTVVSTNDKLPLSLPLKPLYPLPFTLNQVLDSAMSADDKLTDPLFARCSYTLGKLKNPKSSTYNPAH
jgi:hypothetical protein